MGDDEGRAGVTQLVDDRALRFGLAIEDPASTIVDSFHRADGPLGSDWIDGSDWNPAIYEPLGIYNNWVVCRLPLNRANHGAVYGTDQHVSPPTPSGSQYLGIGCAWRETSRTHISVTVRWAGMWSTTAGHHCEAAPLLYVTPGTAEHGVGVWTSELTIGPSTVPVLYLAALGNPPEVFGQGSTPILGVAQYTHTDGQQHDVTMTGNGSTVSVYFDGSLVTFNTGTAIAIPTNLLGSTKHGFAVDTHFVSPPYAVSATAIPTIPIIGHIDIRSA
jgi:hypothetical protein